MQPPDPLPAADPCPVSRHDDAGGWGLDRLVTAIALLATLALIFLTPFG